MDKLKNISDNFFNNIKNAGKDFTLTDSKLSSEIKGTLSAVMLLTALGASFDVNANDIVNFSNNLTQDDISVLSDDLFSANLKDLPMKTENAKTSVARLAKIYDIDQKRNSGMTEEQRSKLEVFDFKETKGGLYINPFNDSHITFMNYNDDTDIDGVYDFTESVRGSYKEVGINSDHVEDFFNYFHKARLGMFADSSAISNNSFDEMHYDGYDVNNYENYVEPSVVFLAMNTPLKHDLSNSNLDHLVYDRMFVKAHETHHSAFVDFIDEVSEKDGKRLDYNDVSTFDIEIMKKSSESSADFAASVIVVQEMIKNNENMDTVNEFLDGKLKSRTDSRSEKHYTVPVLAVVKNIANNNMDRLLAMNPKEIYDLSLNVSFYALENNYEDDYLHKLKSAPNNYFISDDLNKDIHEDNLNLRMNEAMMYVDKFTGTYEFPNFINKIDKIFPSLGLNNTAEKNDLIKELSDESSISSNLVNLKNNNNNNNTFKY